MEVWDYITEKINKKEKIHLALLDPDNQKSEMAGEIAKDIEEAGSDGIMIGGSTVKSRELVYETIREIERQAKIPTILFPNSAATIPENTNWLFFMMLMNSGKIDYLIGEQLKAVSLIENWKISTIPMGYIVISTSKEPTTVEKVGAVDRIEKTNIKKAIMYALLAKNFGMQCIYLEAGSGADDHVPVEMISAVKEATRIPLFVGGGIRSIEAAKNILKAGADAIIMGTGIEQDLENTKKIISFIKKY